MNVENKTTIMEETMNEENNAAITEETPDVDIADVVVELAAAKPDVELVTEAVAEKASMITGVVTNCVRLNVRKGPSTNTAILGVIDVLTEVEINEKASTSGFYKIRTEDGTEGFVMKKFIAIKN